MFALIVFIFLSCVLHIYCKRKRAKRGNAAQRNHENADGNESLLNPLYPPPPNPPINLSTIDRGLPGDLSLSSAYEISEIPEAS